MQAGEELGELLLQAVEERDAAASRGLFAADELSAEMTFADKRGVTLLLAAAKIGSAGPA